MGSIQPVQLEVSLPLFNLCILIITAPPGMSAPGTGAPPGLPDVNNQQQNSYYAQPAVPNINFAAPVIRLGSQAKEPDRRRAGLGTDSRNERPAPIQPQSKEEIIRTLFVGGVDGLRNDDIERVLRAAGNLKRWFRATDADDKETNFGFAEYEDAESLGVAIEIFKDVEVPVYKEGEIERKRVLVIADENSKTYLGQYEEAHDVGEEQKDMMVEQAKEGLAEVLKGLEGPREIEDVEMVEEEVATILVNADDELADIPAEMRETVAKEIAAFRDRSNRRDIERMKREEEIEAQTRNGRRSPPVSAPSGPGGAPSGPRRGFPKDYQKGVTFVNGTGISAASAFDESEGSDEELENRRQERIKSDEEKMFLDAERKWLNRERSRTAAVEREKNRDAEESDRLENEKLRMGEKLKNWDDDDEVLRRDEEYYRDHSMWIRNRAAFRQREAAQDDQDREADEVRQPERVEVERTPDTPREPARFTLKLGAAAQKQAQGRQEAERQKPVANVENLLEAEEDDEEGEKRKLIPIPQAQLDAVKVQVQDMSESERAAAAQQLAAEIPQEKESLWSWNVQWKYIDDDVMEERLKPFVVKKVVEYLGVQEDFLVEVIMNLLKAKKRPDELVKELDGALDEEEADALVRKLWRMVVFFSESGRRGLGA